MSVLVERRSVIMSPSFVQRAAAQAGGAGEGVREMAEGKDRLQGQQESEA